MYHHSSCVTADEQLSNKFVGVSEDPPGKNELLVFKKRFGSHDTTSFTPWLSFLVILKGRLPGNAHSMCLPKTHICVYIQELPRVLD